MCCSCLKVFDKTKGDERAQQKIGMKLPFITFFFLPVTLLYKLGSYFTKAFQVLLSSQIFWEKKTLLTSERQTVIRGSDYCYWISYKNSAGTVSRLRENELGWIWDLGSYLYWDTSSIFVSSYHYMKLGNHMSNSVKNTQSQHCTQTFPASGISIKLYQ